MSIVDTLMYILAAGSVISIAIMVLQAVWIIISVLIGRKLS